MKSWLVVTFKIPPQFESQFFIYRVSISLIFYLNYMVTKQIENTKVTLYTDAEEYTKDFFDISDGAILDTNNLPDLPDSAGFRALMIMRFGFIKV